MVVPFGLPIHGFDPAGVPGVHVAPVKRYQLLSVPKAYIFPPDTCILLPIPPAADRPFSKMYQLLPDPSAAPNVQIATDLVRLREPPLIVFPSVEWVPVPGPVPPPA